MKCDHKRIKSVNCHYFCIDCGEELPEAAVFAHKYDPPNLEGRSTRDQ